MKAENWDKVKELLLDKDSGIDVNSRDEVSTIILLYVLEWSYMHARVSCMFIVPKRLDNDCSTSGFGHKHTKGWFKHIYILESFTTYVRMGRLSRSSFVSCNRLHRILTTIHLSYFSV